MEQRFAVENYIFNIMIPFAKFLCVGGEHRHGMASIDSARM